MNLRHSLFAFLYIFPLAMWGNNIKTAKENNIGIEFKTGVDVCIITVCNENILKIDYRPNGKASEKTPVIDKIKWDYSGANIKNTENQITVTTSKYKAVIDKIPFFVTVYNNNGDLLFKNKKPYQRNLIFTHDTKDNYYGLSGYNRDSYKNGAYPIQRNSGGIIEAQPQGGCGAPFIWSTNGYGVLLDTDGGNVSNANGQIVISGCSKDNFEYYILVGSPREIIKSAGEISGLPPMFPKWNTGFGQMEWGIDEKEFKTHVKGYRDRKIPFDWFMIDFDWMAWGEDNYGEFRWNKKFPNGASGGLKKWADSIGVKMTAITKPRIIAKNADGSFTSQGKYAEDKGFWYPGEEFFKDYVTGLPSKDLQFASPACQKWWWKHLKEGAFDKGMLGFLNDECDDSNRGGLYSLGNFSNIFMQKSIYEGQRAASEMRVWSINRTAYMGSQKYAYSIWSGDNYPTFLDLRSQASKMLTANNVLVPIWGFCMTAFWNTVPITPELYLRSLQFGMFSPLFFLHGIWGQQKQPWFFGEHVINTSREIIDLRYKLIPYMYSYDRIKHETMLGISRALVIDYPNDEKVTDMSDTFMFGDYILASPIMDSAIVSKKIYMPKGTWIDYSNGNIYEGGKSYDYKIDNVNFNDIPMFIKKGAIIPTQDVIAYVGEKHAKIIYVDVFPSKEKTSFPLYDDDGLTYSYEHDDYFKQIFTVEDNGDAVLLNLMKQEGSFKPLFENYIIKLHNRDTENVKIGEKSLKKYNSYESLVISKTDGFFNSSDIYGKLTYIKIAVESSPSKIVVFGMENIIR